MLKTNVITRDYKITARTSAGVEVSYIVNAESPEAARLKEPIPKSWTVLEVTEL